LTHSINDTQYIRHSVYDTQHNEIQHNDIQHNDTQHNDTHHNDIKHNANQRKGLFLILSINDTQYIRHSVYDTQHRRHPA
jgi:hypothetical protein